MSVHVVKATTEDAVAVAARIWAEATARRDGLTRAAPAALKLPGLRAALAVPGAALYLAEQDNDPLGFTLLVPLGSRLEVRYLGVAPRAWGQGIAARLLEHVVDELRARNLDAAELWVLEDNERALAVYLRAGWSLTSDAKCQIETRRTERRLELRTGRVTMRR